MPVYSDSAPVVPRTPAHLSRDSRYDRLKISPNSSTALGGRGCQNGTRANCIWHREVNLDEVNVSMNLESNCHACRFRSSPYCVHSSCKTNTLFVIAKFNNGGL